MKDTLKVLTLAALLLGSSSFTHTEQKTVVIDVSHGGSDKGTTLESFSEKDIALEIAGKIKALNTQNAGLRVVLTREADQNLSLNERATFINGLHPDLVLSIHVNSHKDANKSGTEIFISDNSKEKEKSKQLAEKLQSTLKHQAHAAIKNANLYLLKNVEYPIALLELGYLTNVSDREMLTTSQGQNALAKAIYEVIQ